MMTLRKKIEDYVCSVMSDYTGDSESSLDDAVDNILLTIKQEVSLAQQRTEKKWEHRIKTRIGQTKAWLKKESENSVRLYYLNMIEALSGLLE